MSSQHPVAADLSVVIPTLGRDILRRCLGALESGDVWPACVIIVDQSRNREMEEVIRAFGERGLRTQYIPSDQRGRAAGVNRGIEAVNTRFLAVTDDDCLVAGDWVARMTAKLQAHEGAIVTGRVDAGEGEVVLSTVTSEQAAIQRKPSLRFDRMSGGNMGMPTVLRETIGLFDEDPCVRAAEDVEFSYRALRAGVPIVYAPDVIVQHLGWRGADAREAQYRNYARSHGGFFGKYLRRRDLFVAARAGVHLLRAARRWAAGVVRGDREVALNGRAYVLGLFPGIVAGWRSGARS